MPAALSIAAVDAALAVLDYPTSPVERSVARHVRRVAHLASDALASACPPELIAPTRVGEFAAMPERERLALLVVRFVDHDALRRRSNRTPAESKHVGRVDQARSDAATLKPATVKLGWPAQVSRYWASCADGCGTLLPVGGSAKPVVRYADGHKPLRRPTPRREAVAA